MVHHYFMIRHLYIFISLLLFIVKFLLLFEEPNMLCFPCFVCHLYHYFGRVASYYFLVSDFDTIIYNNAGASLLIVMLVPYINDIFWPSRAPPLLSANSLQASFAAPDLNLAVKKKNIFLFKCVDILLTFMRLIFYA